MKLLPLVHWFTKTEKVFLYKIEYIPEKKPLANCEPEIFL